MSAERSAEGACRAVADPIGDLSDSEVVAAEQISRDGHPLEVTPMTTVRDVFETNTFGVMAMTQAVLPQFRATGGPAWQG